MTNSKRQGLFGHFAKRDLLAAAQIAAQTTTDVMSAVEEIHLSILQRTAVNRLPVTNWLARSTRLVYRGLKLFPKASSALLHPVAFYLHRTQMPLSSQATKERKHVLAALNGIAGDQLAAVHNPITTHMALIKPEHHRDEPVMLFIHGLCMDDQAWDVHQTEALAKSFGYQCWYLRYNSGLSLAENGEALAKLLLQEPACSKPLSIIAHSMGGLVALEAIAYAEEHHPGSVHSIKLVCLGTPFLGAPLAKIGAWLESQLASTAFTLPFKALTERRSIGIRNLQFGSRHIDISRLPVDVYSIAGQLKSNTHQKVDEKVGDGLVTQDSALGFDHLADTSVIENTGHIRLLTDERVFNQIEHWFSRR